MELTVGAILEGKVKSITNFGAFISLPEGKTGMVHISEVANAYVSDIRQHLTEGQDVKVVVIGLENGKINLSIKRLNPSPSVRTAEIGTGTIAARPVRTAASAGRTTLRRRTAPSAPPCSPPPPRRPTSCLRKS